jgi:hypothetical protein
VIQLSVPLSLGYLFLYSLLWLVYLSMGLSICAFMCPCVHASMRCPLTCRRTHLHIYVLSTYLCTPRSIQLLGSQPVTLKVQAKRPRKGSSSKREVWLIYDTVWGAGIARRSWGMCSLARVSTTWREALTCSVRTDFHVYMSGLRLIYLAMLRWSRCTPSLRTGNM